MPIPAKFLHYEIQVAESDAIEVTLDGDAANVMLLDDGNYQNYQTGREFRYTGGYFTHSPAILHAPSSGLWHLVVDLAGAGRVSALVRVLSRA